MATDYTGVPTASESPSPAPSGGVYPIVVLPDDGDDLNAASVAQAYKTLADYAAYTQKKPAAYAFSFTDMFCGSGINIGTWISVSAGGTNTVIDDSAGGGFGALAHTVSGTNSTMGVKTQPFPIGTNDFYASIRVRKATFTTGFYRFGFYDGATETGSCYIACDNNGNWTSHINNVQTTLGIGMSSSYQLVELIRASQHVVFYVNGVSKISSSFTFGMSGTALYSQAQCTSGTSMVIYVDDIACGITRTP